MPSYDYRCDANNQIYEVKHAISLNISTWGELCETANIDLNGISIDTPVKKILRTTGGVVKSSSLKNPEAPPCMTGGGCSGGGCGI